MKIKIVLPPPDNVAAAGKPPGLDRVAAQAPVAQLLYPELTKGGERLNAYPVMIWPQPWLSPNTMLEWPLLIDIDEKPFTTWSKRIAQ